jgi:hypothetical protein
MFSRTMIKIYAVGVVTLFPIVYTAVSRWPITTSFFFVLEVIDTIILNPDLRL